MKNKFLQAAALTVAGIAVGACPLNSQDNQKDIENTAKGVFVANTLLCAFEHGAIAGSTDQQRQEMDTKTRFHFSLDQPCMLNKKTVVRTSNCGEQQVSRSVIYVDQGEQYDFRYPSGDQVSSNGSLTQTDIDQLKTEAPVHATRIQNCFN